MSKDDILTKDISEFCSSIYFILNLDIFTNASLLSLVESTL